MRTVRSLKPLDIAMIQKLHKKVRGLLFHAPLLLIHSLTFGHVEEN